MTAFLRQVGEEVTESGATRAERLARMVWKMAEDGDRSFAQYIFDRLDGKPKERIEQEGETVVRIVFDNDKDSPATSSGEVLEQPGEV